MIEFKNNEFATLYEYMRPIWHDTFDEIVSPAHVEVLLHKYFDSANIQNFLNSGMKYNHIIDEKNVGVIIYRDDDNEIFIDKLYIPKGNRGHSYASQAINSLKNMGKDLWLIVNRHNTHAINVYKHIGFVVEKIVDNIIGENMINEDYYMRYTSTKN